MASLVARSLRKIDTLFIKILISFWTILIVTVICTTIIVGLSDNTDMPLSPQSERQLEGVADHIQDYYVMTTDELPRRIDQVPERHKRGEAVYLVDDQGQLLYQGYPSKKNKIIRQFILDHDDPKQAMVRLSKQSLYFGPAEVVINEQHYLIYVEQKIDSQPNNTLSTSIFIHQNQFQPQLMLGLLAAFSLIACMLLAWHITLPLKQLGDAANRVAMGDLTASLPKINRSDEIGHMAKSFEQMVTTLNTAIINQRRLLSDISHELRSPLTRLNMALGLSNKRYGSSKENDRIAKESDRLEEMIAALLGLSRMQLDESHRETVELHELLCILSDDCEFEAHQLNKSFHYDNTTEIIFSCYPKLMLSAIENLCRNALKYANKDVNLYLSAHSKKLTIQVTDDGPGIDESELEQIFRPFYRSGTARDRNSGGVGLGLAIADSCVRLHGGNINAMNRSCGGLSVTITLPIIG